MTHEEHLSGPDQTWLHLVDGCTWAQAREKGWQWTYTNCWDTQMTSCQSRAVTAVAAATPSLIGSWTQGNSRPSPTTMSRMPLTFSTDPRLLHHWSRSLPKLLRPTFLRWAWVTAAAVRRHCCSHLIIMRGRTLVRACVLSVAWRGMWAREQYVCCCAQLLSKWLKLIVFS